MYLDFYINHQTMTMEQMLGRDDKERVQEPNQQRWQRIIKGERAEALLNFVLWKVSD